MGVSRRAATHVVRSGSAVVCASKRMSTFSLVIMMDCVKGLMYRHVLVALTRLHRWVRPAFMDVDTIGKNGDTIRAGFWFLSGDAFESVNTES